jgi:hypothetical protein
MEKVLGSDFMKRNYPKKSDLSEDVIQLQQRVCRLEDVLHDFAFRECDFCQVWENVEHVDICDECKSVSCIEKSCQTKFNAKTCRECNECMCETCHSRYQGFFTQCAGACPKEFFYHAKKFTCLTQEKCGHGFCLSCQHFASIAFGDLAYATRCRFCLKASAFILLGIFRRPTFKAFVAKEVGQYIAKLVWNVRMQ